jgi:p-hydroxybenzoate 3-monooxygenase
VLLLEGALRAFLLEDDARLLDGYEEAALHRIWKAQNFSYWMTSMLHTRADAGPFERKRQLGELSAVVNSRHGSAYLAEAYTGWPVG